MANSDFTNPNDFPDMRLPEREDHVPEPKGNFLEPWKPRERKLASWRVGDRVLAPWEPHFLYVGDITEIRNEQALIEFGDGDTGWVFLEQIRALAVTPGLKFFSRREMGLHFYPGEIIEVHEDEVLVQFADGQGEE